MIETKSDPISTSPKALQAYKLIQLLDPLVGTVEATFFMQRGNELLGGATPVTAIKEGRIDEVVRAVKAVAIERGSSRSRGSRRGGENETATCQAVERGDRRD